MVAPDNFSLAIERLIQKAPKAWLASACETLKGLQAGAEPGQILSLIPATFNADLTYLMAEVVNLAHGRMSWEALGCTIFTTAAAYERWQHEHHIELLWGGPFPGHKIPARRIDQTLYDLIAAAKREILLVTFAAAKIERLTSELLKAAQRGVSIRLILEFEQSSEGQLNYDALKAFPTALIDKAEIFCWPLEKRKRNPAGRPGKLHAKVAIVDNAIIVSSANLTDDAFNRNLEIGLKICNNILLESMNRHIESLILDGTLYLMKY